MKYNSLIIGLSVLALQSCTDNLVYTGTDIEVVLTGNTYQAAFTESSPVSTFNSGNQILLNASGSLQIDNRILTYMDNQWKAENEFSWSDLTGKTNVTAVYPVYPDLDYVQENLYKNNSLDEGGNLAASKIRNLECPSYEICLIDYGCGKFNRKIHIMEQYP